MIIDRISTDMDELWSRLDYKIFDSAKETGPASDAGCVMERQTQKRLLGIMSVDSSSNNIISSNSGRRAGDPTNGRVGEVSATSGGGSSADDVIKSEHAAPSSSDSVSKVLDRNSSSGNQVGESQRSGWSQSLDRLSCSSSGYLSQQSLPGGVVAGAVTASSSLDAVGLEPVHRVSNSLSRSLSLPGPLARAFHDVSGSPAVLRKGDTVDSGETETSRVARPTSAILPGDWDNASVDNEDDMSLAELARKSGPVGPGSSAQSEDELFAMIRKEWLHFRPKPCEPTDEALQNEQSRISTRAPLNVDLVTLRTDGGTKPEEVTELPSSVFLNSEDNMFQSQPFTLDDLGWKGSANSSPCSSLVGSPSTRCGRVGRRRGGGLLDQSLSGDSLNELSLNLGDDETGEENERVLENILQECQMGDFKILEDPSIFTGLPDTEDEEMDEDGGEVGNGQDPSQLRNLFDRAVGYESEFVSWALESFRGDGRRVRRDTAKSTPQKKAQRWQRQRERLQRRWRVGKSRFKLSRVTKCDETFSPSKESPTDEEGQATPIDGDGQTNGGRMSLDMGPGQLQAGTVNIKQEPDGMLDDGVVHLHEIKVEKPDEVVATGATSLGVQMASLTNTGIHQGSSPQSSQHHQRTGPTRNIIFQGGTNYLAQQGENTIILTSSLNAVKNGQLTEKTRRC